MAQKKYGWKKFFQLIISAKPANWIISCALVASVITTVAGLIVPLFTKKLIDGFSVSSLDGKVVALIVIAFILQAITNGFSIFLLNYMGQKVVATIRERLWRKIMHLPVSYFDNTKTGEMVSRMVSDTVVVKELIADHLPQFVTGIISVIGAVIILFYMDWKMTLIILIAVPITALVVAPLGHKMFKISKGLQNETADFTGTISQTLSEARLVKASNAEIIETEAGHQGIKRLFGFGIREAKVVAVLGPLIFFVVMGVIVGIIGYGGVRVSAGTMTTGTLIAFLLYLFQIIVPVTSFATFFAQLQKAKGATERIADILNETEENFGAGEKVNVAGKTIHAIDISFAYNEGEPILKDVSFDTKPGEIIAFAGPSGGGKSTLFAILERFYEPNTGGILIGNIPLSEISIKSWRSQIGYVSQESAMLSGTIRDNLCYGLDREISEDELWDVAKLAYADGFISGLSNQMATEVGERGVKLSGGQRQRIAIARAFLRNPNILMLDEATASLDSQSELIVQQALANLMEGRTTFVIAHRLSTIVNADQILFIENGEITGRGTHQELVLSHPLYASFAEQQLN
ncbi:multidrug ABC transporter permease [Listeria ivanovii]|uniref:ABC transporter ATP-binding protein n=1 Tax=Listeria ivanovii TaxID=1638 RepID=UPI000DA8DC86|nr:ABC transporter ATP-binding protein [Listeria ivanovii]PZF90570.1 multidrug ABC transporter permease [Listeria ivanovii]PZF95956.1 multidrug ABC transporter permease [Listeria ivanovii]PZG06206.1 multidrug ABC transporter permease [Listeria ivanovii]PZG11011.1 multidrug ABC transporter permease [Listeria ivanovii]PZG28094.1 multidrug ABC transporter permease [Listeria ivanovii]